MKLYRFVVFMFPCFIMPVSTTLALPSPFSANYEGYKYLFGKARATISLSRYGQYYKYTMKSKIRFLWYKNRVFDCSVIKIDDNTLKPIEHVHYEKQDDKYNIRTLFNWQEGVAIADFQGRGKKIKFSIDGQAWDTMSIQVKLMDDVMNQRVNRGDQYQVVQLGKVLDWTITDVGDGPVNIDGQQLDTISLSADFEDESTSLWFSRKHQLLPVQILVNDVLVTLVSNPDLAIIEAHVTEADLTEVPSCKL